MLLIKSCKFVSRTERSERLRCSKRLRRFVHVSHRSDVVREVESCHTYTRPVIDITLLYTELKQLNMAQEYTCERVSLSGSQGYCQKIYLEQEI